MRVPASSIGDPAAFAGDPGNSASCKAASRHKVVALKRFMYRSPRNWRHPCVLHPIRATYFCVREDAGLPRKYDRIAALTAQGFAVLPSAGTYFLNIDLAASGIAEPDHVFARRAVAEHGVASIPVSAFYEENPVTHILRLCFAKADDVLEEGAKRLAAARDSSPR